MVKILYELGKRWSVGEQLGIEEPSPRLVEGQGDMPDAKLQAVRRLFSGRAIRFVRQDAEKIQHTLGKIDRYTGPCHSPKVPSFWRDTLGIIRRDVDGRKSGIIGRKSA